MSAAACDFVLDRIDAFCDGELPADERARVADHVAACADCRAVREGIESLGRDLDVAYAGAAPAPEAVAARVLDALGDGAPIVARPAGSPDAGRGLLAAAGVLAAAAALLAFAMIAGSQSGAPAVAEHTAPPPVAPPLAEPSAPRGGGHERPRATPTVADADGPTAPRPAGDPIRPAPLPAAEVLACIGDATITRASTRRARPAGAGERLVAGDAIRTDEDGMVSLRTPSGARLRVNSASAVTMNALGQLELLSGQVHATAPEDGKLVLFTAGDSLALDPGAVAVVSRDEDGALLWSMVDGAGDLTCVSGMWETPTQQRMQTGFEARKAPGAKGPSMKWSGGAPDPDWVGVCRSREPDAAAQIEAFVVRFIEQRFRSKFPRPEDPVLAYGEEAVAPLLGFLRRGHGKDDRPRPPDYERAYAAELLGRVVTTDGDLLRLVELLRDPEPGVRAAAHARLATDPDLAPILGKVGARLWDEGGDPGRREDVIARLRGILAERMERRGSGGPEKNPY